MTIHRSATIDSTGLCYAEDPDHDEPAEADAEGKCKACGLRLFTDAMQAEVNELARRWSAIQSEIENEGFEREAAYERGEDYDEDRTDEELAAERTRRELKERARRIELDTIEEMLAERGGRMMRPYEHWNEDEAYMEWSERER